jgi:hypothetical protein
VEAELPSVIRVLLRLVRVPFYNLMTLCSSKMSHSFGDICARLPFFPSLPSPLLGPQLPARTNARI